MDRIDEAWIDWTESLAPDKAAAHDEVQARSMAAFRAGTTAERERLRPLLERCEASVQAQLSSVQAQLHLNQGLRRPDGEAGALLGKLLAAIRAELGKE